LKHSEEAQFEYRLAILIRKKSARASLGLGKIYLAHHQFEEARAELEAALKADPNLVEATTLLATLPAPSTPPPAS
jgi:Tfp pilus assembly protein PilF